MILVNNVEVVKTRADRHRVSWDARRSSFVPPESVDDYNFKILWSFDPVSDFVPIINGNNQDVIIDGAIGPFYYLHNLKHTPHDRKHYYKIKAINKITSVSQIFNTVFVGDNFDGILETIRYAEEVLYDQYIGEPIYLAKRKTDGARCPDCWNSLQFKRMKTHCSTCHGTGFYDGFFTPIEIQIAFDSNPKIVDVPQTGEAQSKFIKARASNFPLINPRDMIINKDDYRRWTITKVEITKLPNIAMTRTGLSRNNYILSQILTLAELQPDDDKYNVILVGQDVRGEGDVDFLDLEVIGEGQSSNVGANNLITEEALLLGRGESTNVGSNNLITLEAQLVGQGFNTNIGEGAVIAEISQLSGQGQSSNVSSNALITEEAILDGVGQNGGIFFAPMFPWYHVP